MELFIFRFFFESLVVKINQNKNEFISLNDESILKVQFSPNYSKEPMKENLFIFQC